ncbi:MAG: ABC transporter ATP-binding protein [Methanobacteriota archaeon]|nr:MAG: ABC transporter ATP-binding protein [Euryarchaeota archaeon]
MEGDRLGVLELQNVSYSYSDGTVALQNLDWVVQKGEKVALLGPNGAGKSTLLKILAGLMFPKGGTVWIDGMELTKKNADILRRRIGVLFQDPDDQIFMPRVWDDVAFGPVNMDMSISEVTSVVSEAIQKVGLQGLEDRVPHHMSYGEKKRVAIAGVLAMKPEILLLDEPTSNLDPRGRSELVTILRSLENTIIVATHDVNVASMIAEKAMVLNKQKLTDGPLREVFSQTSLLESANLEVPDVTKLFISLKEEGLTVDNLPLSVKEGTEHLKRLLD